jgi:tRNA(fMet)-specific endonuclease VapC
MTLRVLDTNAISAIWRSQQGMAADSLLVARFLATPPYSILISTITLTEQMRGMLSLVQRLEKLDKDVEGQNLYVSAFRFLQRFAVVEYDEAAHQRFLSFPASVRRQGRADCQIAAVAIEHDLIVVTQNVRHFANIPGVRFEDWTRPDS